MKKSLLATLAALLFVQTGFTQTKLIFHRSHSGSDLSFSLDGPDNLGYFPQKFTEEEIKEMNEAEAKEQKKLLEEEKQREHEAKIIEDARKKEAARLAEIEKQKQAEAEKQKLIQAEKNKTYAKDSAVKVNSAKVIKDTTAKTHKRQFYSPYGLPTNRIPKPEAKIQSIKSGIQADNPSDSVNAGFPLAAWLLLSAAGLSWFLVKK